MKQKQSTTKVKPYEVLVLPYKYTPIYDINDSKINESEGYKEFIHNKFSHGVLTSKDVLKINYSKDKKQYEISYDSEAKWANNNQLI